MPAQAFFFHDVQGTFCTHHWVAMCFHSLFLSNDALLVVGQTPVRHNKNMSGVQFVCLLMCVRGPVHSGGGTTVSLCTQRSDYVICIGRLTFAFLDIWGRATPVTSKILVRKLAG